MECGRRGSNSSSGSSNSSSSSSSSGSSSSGSSRGGGSSGSSDSSSGCRSGNSSSRNIWSLAGFYCCYCSIEVYFSIWLVINSLRNKLVTNYLWYILILIYLGQSH